MKKLSDVITKENIHQMLGKRMLLLNKQFTRPEQCSIEAFTEDRSWGLFGGTLSTDCFYGWYNLAELDKDFEFLGFVYDQTEK